SLQKWRHLGSRRSRSRRLRADGPRTCQDEVRRKDGEQGSEAALLRPLGIEDATAFGIANDRLGEDAAQAAGSVGAGGKPRRRYGSARSSFEWRITPSLDSRSARPQTAVFSEELPGETGSV